MSFGLSANPERSVMVGADVVVAWVDKQTLQGYAIDYILDAKSQCSGSRGSCPDTQIEVRMYPKILENLFLKKGTSISFSYYLKKRTTLCPKDSNLFLI